MNTAFQLENPFWRFSLAVYTKSGVEQECLALQRVDGFDVNLLLFAAWCGSDGKRLSRADFDQCEGAVRSWQKHVVKPLRESRAYLKKLADYDETAVTALRSELGTVELRAEQIEQAILFAETLRLGKLASSDRDGAVRSNLDLYLALWGYTRHAVPALAAALP